MQDTRRQLGRSAAPPEQPAGSEAVAAFEEAYLRYAPRLQRIAIRRFHIEPAEAEVLVQDVFTTWVRPRIGSWRNESTPRLVPQGSLLAGDRQSPLPGRYELARHRAQRNYRARSSAASHVLH